MKITRPNCNDYRKLRAAHYPALTVLADALVHQAAGNPQPLADYLAKCQAVKDRYPKPKK
jgi:hypothetical protein